MHAGLAWCGIPSTPLRHLWLRRACVEVSSDILRGDSIPLRAPTGIIQLGVLLLLIVGCEGMLLLLLRGIALI